MGAGAAEKVNPRERRCHMSVNSHTHTLVMEVYCERTQGRARLTHLTLHTASYQR